MCIIYTSHVRSSCIAFHLHFCSIYMSCLYAEQHICCELQHTALGVAVQNRCRAGQGRNVAAHSWLTAPLFMTCNNVQFMRWGVVRELAINHHHRSH